MLFKRTRYLFKEIFSSWCFEQCTLYPRCNKSVRRSRLIKPTWKFVSVRNLPQAEVATIYVICLLTLCFLKVKKISLDAQKATKNQASKEQQSTFKTLRIIRNAIPKPGSMLQIWNYPINLWKWIVLKLLAFNRICLAGTIDILMWLVWVTQN